MARTRNAVARHKRNKRILKEAKGFRGGRSKLLRSAKENITRAGQYAYRDRKKRKGQFRKLWIARINAACRLEGMSYSRFMFGLRKANIELNRKQLSEMAIHDPSAFKAVVEKAKASI